MRVIRSAKLRTRVGCLSLGVIAASLVLVLFSSLPGAHAQAEPDDGVPGDGQVVRLARASWDTGWFQSEILAALLGELGYAVEGPSTLENADFYNQVSAGTIDVWANGWFPLHEPILEDGSEPVGFEVRGGALQGYLIDRATAEELGIESLSDLAADAAVAAFDRDGDGVADLVGCNAEWSCRPIVDEQLAELGLQGAVNQISGDYGPLMLDLVARFERGEPVLFYTFTPHWATGLLVPGRDVVWLPVPGIGTSSVGRVPGCLEDPCPLGFEPNDIRSVANTDFLDENPAIDQLLQAFEIPLSDIADQNAAMIAGQDSGVDITSHASRWIAANRTTVDDWLTASAEAHLEAGLELNAPRAPASATDLPNIASLTVVTRIEPPFVTYENNAYGGFSIEVVELLAQQLGAELDLYGVNSSAKVLDDVARRSADLGIGAIAITSQREHTVDFSQPYYESGLQILVAEDGAGAFGGRLGAVFSALFSRDLMILLLVLAVVLIIAAHIIWLAERKHNPDFPAEYRAGIWEALWWAAVTATTVGYGDKTPKGRGGRLFGLFWMFSGLFVLAYFTAGIATAFTIDELANQIETTSDLRGHEVGVTADSDALDYLARQGIPARSYTTSSDAFDALQAGDLDAVVHDAAVLQHFVANDLSADASLASLVFAERGFGLVLPADDARNEVLNRALLQLVESEEYAQLHDTWFGPEAD